VPHELALHRQERAHPGELGCEARVGDGAHQAVVRDGPLHRGVETFVHGRLVEVKRDRGHRSELGGARHLELGLRVEQEPQLREARVLISLELYERAGDPEGTELRAGRAQVRAPPGKPVEQLGRQGAFDGRVPKLAVEVLVAVPDPLGHAPGREGARGRGSGAGRELLLDARVLGAARRDGNASGDG